MTIPLAQRRRAPVPVLFTIVCALAVGSFLISPTASWPLEPYVALLLAFYWVGAHCSDRTSLLAGLAALATIVCIDFVRSPFQTSGVRPGAWLTFVVAWLVGQDLRRRRRELKLLRERAGADELLHAVRVVAAGEALLSPSITRRLIEDYARRPPARKQPAALVELTPRELEVLRLIARGLSNREIARELVVGDAAIKTHVARIFAKLDLHDRAQAVVLAYESGLVQPGATAPGG